MSLSRVPRTCRRLITTASTRNKQAIPGLESFARRHVGPSAKDRDTMLKTCGVGVSGAF